MSRNGVCNTTSMKPPVRGRCGSRNVFATSSQEAPGAALIMTRGSAAVLTRLQQRLRGERPDLSAEYLNRAVLDQAVRPIP